MKTPVVIVAVSLTIAILLAASFLIATGTRGEVAPAPFTVNPADRILPTSPAAK
jgi:hypothetical protein